jgi:hypothetical protein
MLQRSRLMVGWRRVLNSSAVDRCVVGRYDSYPMPNPYHLNRRYLLKASVTFTAVYLTGCGGSRAEDSEPLSGVDQGTPAPPAGPTAAPPPASAPPASPPPAAEAPQGLSSLPPATEPVTPPAPPINPLPSWLAPVGTVADLSLNTVDQAAGRRVNFWKAWSGVGWAPWWGRLGSVIIAGGGHGDGSENDIYRFDVEERVVSRIKQSAPIFYKQVPGMPVADKLTGWMWASSDVGDTSTQEGELFAVHEYSGLQAIPEPGIPGKGASHGWLFAAGRGGMPLDGQSQTSAGFKLRLGIDQKWTHQGPLAHSKVQGFDPIAHRKATCYDPSRRLVWFKGGAYYPSTTMCYRKTVDGSSGYLTFSNVDGIDGIDGYQVLEYASAHDCLVQGCEVIGSSPKEYSRLRVWDLATGRVYQPSQLGTKPPVPHSTWAMCWSDVWNCMAFISGQGDNTIYFLKPTGNLRSDPWQWSSQTVSGTVRSGYIAGGGLPSFNRLRHCTALGDVLIWCGKTDEPIQMIHVSPP